MRYWLRYFSFLITVTVLLFVLLVHAFEYRRLKDLYSEDFSLPDSNAIAVHRRSFSRSPLFAEHPNGRIFKHYNNHGFVRDDSTKLLKTPGVTRVLITGDSHTDGLVSTAENFCTLLQDTLNRLGKTFELLNGGAGNYSFINYQGLIQHYAYLQPDEYLVMVYTGNDFIENLMYRYRWYNPLQSLRQFRSRLGWRYQYPLMYNNQSLTQVLYFHLYPQQKDDALAIACSSVVRISEYCRTKGIRLSLAFIPTDFDLDAGYRQRLRTAYGFPDASLDVNRWFTSSLQQFARAKGISVYDLHPAMQRWKDTLFYPKDHHLNVRGNQVVAELMLPAFLR